jgi:hypothetical protein
METEVQFKLLEAKLLEIGGEAVTSDEVVPEILDALLNRGQRFGTRGREILKTGCICHWPEQIALHYAEHQAAPELGVRNIAFGYGLLGGVWQRHAWVTNGARVFDHVDLATKYYGFVLNPVEAVGYVSTHLMASLEGYEDSCDGGTQTVEQIGEIRVDSGLCWIGDPRHVIHRDQPLPKAIGTNWQNFCDGIREEDTPFRSRQFNHDSGQSGLGVAVESGYGGGVYSVMAAFNEEGRVSRVWVDFIDTAA